MLLLASNQSQDDGIRSITRRISFLELRDTVFLFQHILFAYTALYNLFFLSYPPIPAVRTEVLKSQQSGAAFISPPTRDRVLAQRAAISPLVPPVKSPFRLHNG